MVTKPFESLEAALQWVQQFVAWYNGAHRHSQIKFVTPNERHANQDKAILGARDALYQTAKARHPERWSGQTRDWTPVGEVALNPDKAKHESNRVRSTSNGPHIKHLKSLGYRFILGAKQGDHPYLFEWVATSPATHTYSHTDTRGIEHRFRYHNGVPLNDSHSDLEVNFVEYWEVKPNDKTQHFSWVSDLFLDEDKLMQVMRAGRARWRIENEAFNTLKNQGYQFEHNFGHGHRHLTTVLMHLMILAFLIDQIQQRCCRLFQSGIEKMGSKMRFWRKLRERFNSLLIDDWETLYGSLAYKLKPMPIVIDTS